uniref:hypothetical protein n=1 Tax=Odoribacter splanchnicus TaxID=28118 RepID=UPI001E62F384
FCNGKIILFTEINNSKRGYPTFWTAPSFLVFWDGPFVPEYLLSKDYNLLVIYYRFEILK